MRVMIAEDHPRLAEAIATVLRRDGIAVDVAFDGSEALHRTALTAYDVIVLDRDLPRVHGDDVCRSLVADGNSATVLMLTASGTLADRVQGLGIGADDYLTKPFAMAELVARIHALARRSRRPLPPTLAHGDLKLDCARRAVTRGGRPVPLSPRNWRCSKCCCVRREPSSPARRSSSGHGMT